MTCFTGSRDILEATPSLSEVDTSDICPFPFKRTRYELGLLLTFLTRTKNSSLHATNPPSLNTQQRHPLPSPLSLRQCDTYCVINYGHFEITPSNLIGSQQCNLFMYCATFFPANDNGTLKHPENQCLFKVATQIA